MLRLVANVRPARSRRGWPLLLLAATSLGLANVDLHEARRLAGVSLLSHSDGPRVGLASSSPMGEGSAGDRVTDGDPVDLSTGLYMRSDDDIVTGDHELPITLTRAYLSRDHASRHFGIGTTMSFDIGLYREGHELQTLYLVQEDGSRVPFQRVNPDSRMKNAVFEHRGSVTEWYGARIRYKLRWWKIWPHNGWEVERRDGSKYAFICAFGEDWTWCWWNGFRDAHGNTLAFDRDSTSNLYRVESGKGAAIDFTYDAQNRITRAQAGPTSWVEYAYDPVGRLVRVQHVTTHPILDALAAAIGHPPSGPTIRRQEYTYDDRDHMVTIRESNGLLITNTYDGKERVVRQVISDGSEYTFHYTENADGKVVGTDVVREDDRVRRVAFDAEGYELSDTWPLGAPDEVAITYEREPGTERLLAMTLSCTALDGTRGRVRDTLPPGEPDEGLEQRLRLRCHGFDLRYFSPPAA